MKATTSCGSRHSSLLKCEHYTSSSAGQSPYCPYPRFFQVPVFILGMRGLWRGTYSQNPNIQSRLNVFRRLPFHLPFDARVWGLHSDNDFALFDCLTLHTSNKCANHCCRYSVHYGVPVFLVTLKLYTILSTPPLYDCRHGLKSSQTSSSWCCSNSRKKVSVVDGLTSTYLAKNC